MKKANPHAGDIGYANPPRHSQFKPGTSGNPRGRPRREQDDFVLDILGKELFRMVPIQQGGKTIKQPAFQLAVRRLGLAAMKGDPQAVKAMVQLTQFYDGELAIKKSKMPPMTAKERIEKIADIFDKVAMRVNLKSARRAEVAKRQQTAPAARQ